MFMENGTVRASTGEKPLLLEPTGDYFIRPFRLPDGGCELRLTVTGENDVLRWILGFGPEVEVLEPEWLRERLASISAQLNCRYAHGALPP